MLRGVCLEGDFDPAGCHGPVVWSPHYGGFWVVLGYDELVEAAKDWETYSSSGPLGNVALTANGARPARQNGLFLPPRPNELPLLEDDPPNWKVLRQALNPLFLPAAVAQ